MAQTIVCDSEDGNAADLLVTQIANGDTLALCSQCVPLWAQSLVDTLAEPVPEPPAEVIMSDAMGETAAPPEQATGGGDQGTDGPARSGGKRGAAATATEAAPTAPDKG